MPLSSAPITEYYGTLEPFVAQAVYPVLTDNNDENQSGDNPTWQLKLEGENGEVACVEFIGSDVKGLPLVNNLALIPILDQHMEALALAA